MTKTIPRPSSCYLCCIVANGLYHMSVSTSISFIRFDVTQQFPHSRRRGGEEGRRRDDAVPGRSHRATGTAPAFPRKPRAEGSWPTTRIAFDSMATGEGPDQEPGLRLASALQQHNAKGSPQFHERAEALRRLLDIRVPVRHKKRVPSGAPDCPRHSNKKALIGVVQVGKVRGGRVINWSAYRGSGSDCQKRQAGRGHRNTLNLPAANRLPPAQHRTPAR